MQTLWEKLPPLVGPGGLLRLKPDWKYGRWATYALFHRSDVPVVRHGKKLLVSREALRRWFESGGAAGITMKTECPPGRAGKGEVG